MSEVWQKDLRGSDQIIMLCLADFADDYGGSVFPSVALVGWKCGMSTRSVQRALAKFRKNHFLVVEQQATATAPTVYRINVGIMPCKRPYSPDSSCSASLREDTIERFMCICQWCQKDGDKINGPDGNAWHIDRILPGSKGGRYEPSNVVLSCGTCNRKRGAKLASQGVPPDASRGAIAESSDPSVEPPKSSSIKSKSAFPESLDTIEFHEAWDDWLAWRKKNNRAAYKSDSQLKRIAEWGVDRAIKAIHYSITQEFQGIYEERKTPAGTNRRGSGSRNEGTFNEGKSHTYAGAQRLAKASQNNGA